VQIYGKVNQATMFWDDGAEQNVYSVNNQYSSTRFGFESAAMHLYLAYQHFDADMSLVTRDPSVSEWKAEERASVDRRLRPDLFGRPHLLLTDLLFSGVKTALRGGLFFARARPWLRESWTKSCGHGATDVRRASGIFLS